MLEVKQLGCERDGRVLFSNLSFTLSYGEILQIQGRNGAGKTTLLRILAGLSRDFQGEIFWDAEPLENIYADFRLNCYFAGHQSGLKLELSPVENLNWRLQIANQFPKNEQVLTALERVGLAGFEDISCHHLSAGQLRRVALAGLLMSNARLWILDEPFTAIDAEGVHWLKMLFEEHVASGGMLLLTSHQPLNFPDAHFARINVENYQEQLYEGA